MRISKPPHERKAELMAAARRLFDLKGVSDTRVSDIVKEVGVSQGIFYYYFPSKDYLVEQVAAEVGRELDARTMAILQQEGADFCKKLAGFIDLLLDLVDQFTGDDAVRITFTQQKEWEGISALKNTGRMMVRLKRLLLWGAENQCFTAAYPWHTAKVLLYGFSHLAEQRMPARHEVYSITEQALGIPQGRLVKYV